jgi:23S rRNA (adenine2030-N6)-methyltransferase
MLSYRHGFHAGNFADVLKHVVLTLILDHLGKKDKPLCCVDTHAGPGTYSLTGEYARKTMEYTTGIGRLWHRNDLPAAVARYVSVVKQLNGNSELRDYPGSPYFFKRVLRDGDRLFLFELHSTEIELLKAFAQGDKRIKVVHGDGLSDCIGLFPPEERRGLVLLDPSYEIKTDYRATVETLAKLHRRFATGIYIIWYPIIERHRVRQMERAVKKGDAENVHLFELGVRPDARGHGMTGSGVIVVNPPWTLNAEMRGILPYLAGVLGEDGGGYHRADVLRGE